jgi:hypothetical protein
MNNAISRRNFVRSSALLSAAAPGPSHLGTWDRESLKQTFGF